MRVPLPDRKDRLTPMFAEPELTGIISDMVNRRLAELGINIMDLELDKYGVPVFAGKISMGGARKKKKPPEKIMAETKPVLRLFWLEEEGGAL